MKDCYPCYHQKHSNYYLLSNFYKEFIDFDLTQKDFVNFHGFENEEYKYNNVGINNIFFSPYPTEQQRQNILQF